MNKKYGQQSLSPSDLEPLQTLQEDLVVKTALVYAELVKNEASHIALQLEHDRLVAQLTEVDSDIEYIENQYGDE
jgi:hypothetical protein